MELIKLCGLLARSILLGGPAILVHSRPLRDGARERHVLVRRWLLVCAPTLHAIRLSYTPFSRQSGPDESPLLQPGTHATNATRSPNDLGTSTRIRSRPYFDVSDPCRQPCYLLTYPFFASSFLNNARRPEALQTEIQRSHRIFPLDHFVLIEIYDHLSPVGTNIPGVQTIRGTSLDAVERQLFKSKSLSPRAAPFVPATKLLPPSDGTESTERTNDDDVEGEREEEGPVNPSTEEAPTLTAEEEAEIAAAATVRLELENRAARVIQRWIKKRRSRINDRLKHSQSAFVVFWSSYVLAPNLSPAVRGPLVELLYALQAQCKLLAAAKKYLQERVKNDKTVGDELDSLFNLIPECG